MMRSEALPPVETLPSDVDLSTAATPLRRDFPAGWVRVFQHGNFNDFGQSNGWSIRTRTDVPTMDDSTIRFRRLSSKVASGYFTNTRSATGMAPLRAMLFC